MPLGRRRLCHLSYGLAFVRVAVSRAKPASRERIQFTIFVVRYHLCVLPQRGSRRLHRGGSVFLHDVLVSSLSSAFPCALAECQACREEGRLFWSQIPHRHRRRGG